MSDKSEELKSMIKSDDELWKSAVEEFYNDLDSIRSLEFDKINDLDYWVEQLLDSKYLPLLCISDGHYALRYFNEKTDVFLIKCSLMVIKAYIEVYGMFGDGMFERYEYSMGSALDKNCFNYAQDIYRIVKDDIKILQKELTRLEKLVEAQNTTKAIADLWDRYGTYN